MYLVVSRSQLINYQQIQLKVYLRRTNFSGGGVSKIIRDNSLILWMPEQVNNSLGQQKAKAKAYNES